MRKTELRYAWVQSLAYANHFEMLSRIVLHTAVVLLIAGLPSPAGAGEQVVVAVVTDGPSDRLDEFRQKYIDELLVLTAGEFDVDIRPFEAAWTHESMVSAIDAAYSDPDIDLVLITGFVSNQFAATRRQFPKPTFLPIIIDVNLLAVQPPLHGSGIPNLNYLTAYADFATDLDVLASIVPYRKLALLIDATLASAIPELRQAALDISEERGVELVEITHNGIDHNLTKRISDDTDAVIVAALPRMPDTDFVRLVEALNSEKLPSYSFFGVPDVERGLLATNSEPRDIDRQARLNALNMQAVMLGGRAQDQTTASTIKEQLTLNMATARRIGVSPNFNVLEKAVLLNVDEEVGGEALGLVEIARLALAQNQDLQAESFGVMAGFEEISRARSNLLPQVGISAGHTLRKDSPSVTAGLFAERSNDAALNFDQLIYSDAASANYRVQKELQRARRSSLKQFQLDVVLASTTAYYTVLNARSQLKVQENNLRITRANLELAEDRVRVGTSTRADVYRWQAELARAQINVFNSRAALNQSWETLSRLLHSPQGTRIALRDAGFHKPFIMSQAEFDELVASPADYAVFTRFYVDRALRQAPELEQLNAQIAAKQREVVSARRAYWLPDFAVGARYTSNLSQSGLGAGPQAGLHLNDWSIGVQATLPLFSGGEKHANVSRASYELRQLQSLFTSTQERVEEQVRIQMHLAEAAYAQIGLSAAAADASRKNFDLVSDAYARGTVTIIDLLDAQDSSLSASASAVESLYSFLITIMNVQRSVGSYDFLLTPNEREALSAEFRATLSGAE